MFWSIGFEKLPFFINLKKRNTNLYFLFWVFFKQNFASRSFFKGETTSFTVFFLWKQKQKYMYITNSASIWSQKKIR